MIIYACGVIEYAHAAIIYEDVALFKTWSQK